MKLLTDKVNINFFYLLFGQTISQLGDKFYSFALAYLVLNTTKSTTAMGTVILFPMLSSIITGFLLGGFIDRHSRKAILIITDIIRGLVIAAVTLLFSIDALTLPIIIFSQIILSVCSAFFSPTVFSVLPQIVKKDRLAKANARMQLITASVTIIGPLLAGVMVANIGYIFIFIFNTISFFLATILTTKINIPSVAKKVNKVQNKFSDGYKYIFKKKSLLAVVIVVAVGHFFVGAIDVVIPALSIKLRGNGAQNMGYIQTFFGVGALAASILLNIVNINNREDKVLFTSLYIIGGIYILLGVLFTAKVMSVVPYLFVFLLYSSVIMFAATCFQVILQKNIEESMSGRVWSIVNSLGNCSMPLAVAVVGFMLDYIRFAYLTTAIGITIFPLVTFLCILYSKGNIKKEIKQLIIE